MPPTLVEVPAIERPGRKGVSKYVKPEDIEATIALVRAQSGWVGGLIEPVDTIVKARIAAKTWRMLLSEAIGHPEEAFATRVFSPLDPKDKKGERRLTDQFTFAIALKQGVEETETQAA